MSAGHHDGSRIGDSRIPSTAVASRGARPPGAGCAGQEARAVLRFDDLEVDLARELVKLDGEPIHLTPTQHHLLEVMATNPGKLLTHRWPPQKVWGPAYQTESDYLRTFVRQLRQKLGDDPAAPRFIVTEPGLGYRWKPEPETA